MSTGSHQSQSRAEWKWVGQTLQLLFFFIVRVQILDFRLLVTRLSAEERVRASIFFEVLVFNVMICLIVPLWFSHCTIWLLFDIIHGFSVFHMYLSSITRRGTTEHARRGHLIVSLPLTLATHRFDYCHIVVNAQWDRPMMLPIQNATDMSHSNVGYSNQDHRPGHRQPVRYYPLLKPSISCKSLPSYTPLSVHWGIVHLEISPRHTIQHVLCKKQWNVMESKFFHIIMATQNSFVFWDLVRF